jgi:23S rRNA (uracil1939-C5)-methyltransferase
MTDDPTSPAEHAASPPVVARALRWFARGRCLVEDDSGATFLTEGAVPGERVRVERVETPRGRMGRVVEVLEPAVQRVVPLCPHAALCTGCSLLHVDRASELALKAQTVREVLDRWAQLPWSEPIPVLTDPRRGDHRVRHRASVVRTDGDVRVGLRDLEGAIVHAPDCAIVFPAIRRVLRCVCDALRGQTTPLNATLEIRCGADGLAVLLEGIPSDELPALRAALPTDATCVATRPDPRVPWEVVFGAWPRPIPVDGRAVADSIDAWMQPAPAHASALYDWVASQVNPGERLLDATCGTGGLTLRLAESQSEVLGVDASWDAVQTAQRTAKLRGVGNAAFRGGRIQTVAPRLVAAGERFDTVLVNPMRVSLGVPTMDALLRLTRGRLLYLGPAPQAAAVDLRSLLDLGGHLQTIVAADLHPGTGAVMLCFVVAPAGARLPPEAEAAHSPTSPPSAPLDSRTRR